jgi:hypothetical protein
MKRHWEVMRREDLHCGVQQGQAAIIIIERPLEIQGRAADRWAAEERIGWV